MTQCRGPLGLDEVLNVHARHRDGQSKLDDELVTRCVGTVDRCDPPAQDLALTLISEAIGDPALGICAPGGLDQTVTLQPGQNVDLPETCRP